MCWIFCKVNKPTGRTIVSDGTAYAYSKRNEIYFNVTERKTKYRNAFVSC